MNIIGGQKVEIRRQSAIGATPRVGSFGGVHAACAGAEDHGDSIGAVAPARAAEVG
jgi:hypothetical protein